MPFNGSLHGLMNANYSEGYMVAGHHGPFSWILLVLIVLAVVYLISRFGRHRHGERHDALSILSQRYANGEIDEAEYREKRNVLKSRH